MVREGERKERQKERKKDGRTRQFNVQTFHINTFVNCCLGTSKPQCYLSFSTWYFTNKTTWNCHIEIERDAEATQMQSLFGIAIAINCSTRFLFVISFVHRFHFSSRVEIFHLVDFFTRFIAFIPFRVVTFLFFSFKSHVENFEFVCLLLITFNFNWKTLIYHFLEAISFVLNFCKLFCFH